MASSVTLLINWLASNQGTKTSPRGGLLRPRVSTRVRMLPRRELTDELKRLLTCIGRLEPDRQRMLLLAYYGAFSRDQLSVKLDMPVNLLRASLRRSLVEVEQCLKS